MYDYFPQNATKKNGRKALQSGFSLLIKDISTGEPMYYQHNLDPVLFSVEPFISIHWYGMMYVAAFFLGWGVARYLAGRPQALFSKNDVEDLVTYMILGVILGGRIGYVLFYDLPYYLAHPLDIIKIWQGGMSFHGGFLGVLFALLYWAKKHKRDYIELTDFIAPCVPIGLFCGRIGNFINGELWGKESTLPWAVIFPSGGNVPRHPSQLYEAGLEGLLLFAVLFFLARKNPPKGVISAVFCIGYGLARCFAEFFRIPDPQYGYFFGFATMGQILCLPMFLTGFILLYLSKKWKDNPKYDTVRFKDGTQTRVRRYKK